MFPMFDDLDEPQAAFPFGLVNAVKNKRYPTLYTLLNKLDGPLRRDAACQLLRAGLECSIGAFRVILDHCPPVTELTDDGNLQFYELDDGALDLSSRFCSFTLLDKAALDDRPEHLDELLRRGCSPNGPSGRDRCSGSSALLAAFLGRSPRCVRRLVREPELDTALTPSLLSQWARVGLKGSEELEQCCRAAAPRLLGADRTGSPLFHGVPIPPQLEVKTVLSQRNFPLAEFLCRNRELSIKEAAAAMEELAELVSELDPPLGPHSFYWKSRPRKLSRQRLCSMLDALFTACPQLLRRRLPRTLLLFTALSGKSLPPLLRPWLDRLRGRRILLDFKLGYVNLSLALFFWEERLGARWVPVLDPQRVSFPPFFYNFPLFGPSGPTPLDLLLSRCRLQKFPPGKKLTELSLAVLHLAPMPLLLRQLQPGGLLSMEDPKLLLDYCLPPGAAQTRIIFHSHYSLAEPLTSQRRRAVLAHLKMEVDYAL